MRMLGTLNGRGMLSSDSGDLGEVDYNITKFKTPSGAHDAAGKVVGDAVVLQDAFDAGKLKLTRSDTGRTMDIAIKSLRGVSDAEVVFAGPDWGD